MKVRVSQLLYYVPTLLDRWDGRTGLTEGERVMVINVHGCPPANAMDHCYVRDENTDKFIGMVCTNSLHTKEAYMSYLRQRIEEKELAG